MVYLGPLLAAAILWSRRPRTAIPRPGSLAGIAALAFIAAAVVSAATIADYWSHPHFIKVRSMTFDFWQNLQFVIPLAGLARVDGGRVGLARLAAGAGAARRHGGSPPSCLPRRPGARLLHEHSMLYPPAHYLAREAAGLLLAVMLACMWLHVAWQRRPPRLLVTLRLPAVSRRLVAAMTVLVLAAALPDVVLTRLWSDYLGCLRGVVDSRQGIVRASELPLLDWPDKLFAQDWSCPALSAHREPHARPGVPAGRQRLPEQPAVRSGLRDPAAPEGLRLAVADVAFHLPPPSYGGGGPQGRSGKAPVEVSVGFRSEIVRNCRCGLPPPPFGQLPRKTGEA